MFSIADQLQNVRQRIQKATDSSGRAPDSIKLLAVSKKKPAQAVLDLYRLGQRDFGESYISEALEKQHQLASLMSEEEALDLCWHFVGPIQSNKTRAIAENFAWVHGVDRLKIARRLSEQRPGHLGALNVCIQVNIDEESTKSGILPVELPELAKNLVALPNLRLRGLMAIPKASDSEQEQADSFARMQALYRKLKEQYETIDTLSMGMSGDIEQAIAHGSTVVRVGTALFGNRS